MQGSPSLPAAAGILSLLCVGALLWAHSPYLAAGGGAGGNGLGCGARPVRGMFLPRSIIEQQQRQQQHVEHNRTGVPPAAGAAASSWPHAVSRVDWRPRRGFDLEAAVTELGYPRRSTGGLLRDDRAILWRIYASSDSVFEMGVGESTQVAVFTGVPRFTGVDGSTAWLANISAASPPHYRFHWADIGAIGKWSIPQDDSTAPKWPFYSFAALAAESEAFDFYLVDGRFRVASVFACFLHASRCGRAPDGFRVGLHDFQRRHYHDVLQIANVVEGYDGSAPYPDPPKHPEHPGPIVTILRRKKAVTDAEVLALWERYKDDQQ